MTALETKKRQNEIISKMSNQEVLNLKKQLRENPVLDYELWMNANDCIDVEIKKRQLS